MATAQPREIKLPLGWKGAWLVPTFTGGPFDSAPVDHYRVAVRAEMIDPANVDLHLPIRDFSTPDDDEEVEDILVLTYLAALNGQKVYVGCRGGFGRTGLFLALLAKVAGIENPVGWVRVYYNLRAVETERQAAYVQEFDVSNVRKRVIKGAWLSRLDNLLGRRG